MGVRREGYCRAQEPKSVVRGRRETPSRRTTRYNLIRTSRSFGDSYWKSIVTYPVMLKERELSPY